MDFAVRRVGKEDGCVALVVQCVAHMSWSLWEQVCKLSVEVYKAYRCSLCRYLREIYHLHLPFFCYQFFFLNLSRLHSSSMALKESPAFETTNPSNVYSGKDSLKKYFDPDFAPPLPLVELPPHLNPYYGDGVRIYAKMMSMHPANNVKAIPGMYHQTASLVYVHFDRRPQVLLVP